MTPQPMLFYPKESLIQAWVADVRQQSSLKGACLRLRITEAHFRTIETRQETLPLRVVEQLKLLPVKEVHSSALVGYVSHKPLNLGVQWD